MSKTIYVVDENTSNSQKITQTLIKNDFTATSFSTGLELLMCFSQKPCDLIIVDSECPVINGYDICLEIRKISDVPVIMLSNNTEKDYVVRAFEVGCDDYIEKPLNVREVLMKAQLILKRIGDNGQCGSDIILRHGDLVINLGAHTFMIKDQQISFTPKEFNLLVLLLKNKNLVFSRDKIIENIWNYDYEGDSRQVDHLVKRLRKKINQSSGELQIETVWGLGYKLAN